MRAINLTDRIRMVHCDDAEGGHGVLILDGVNGTQVKSYEDQREFKHIYNNFCVEVETMKELSLVAA